MSVTEVVRDPESGRLDPVKVREAIRQADVRRRYHRQQGGRRSLRFVDLPEHQYYEALARQRGEVPGLSRGTYWTKRKREQLLMTPI